MINVYRCEVCEKTFTSPKKNRKTCGSPVCMKMKSLGNRMVGNISNPRLEDIAKYCKIKGISYGEYMAKEGVKNENL